MKTAEITAARQLTELLRFSSIISFTFDGMHERFDLIVRVPCHSCSYSNGVDEEENESVTKGRNGLGNIFKDCTWRVRYYR